MKLARVVPIRRWVQIVMALIVVAIGIQFTLWVTAHLEGRTPPVSRPPGAEGFLPIDGMMAARHLIHTGEIDPIHPAGLAIFLGICLMSLVVAKSFCSTLCPVGLISEWLGRLGIRLVGDTLTIFIRDLWCRYLCPYGALVGVLGRFAVFKVSRDTDLCTDCRACTAVCPARIPIHRMTRVSSIECTSCQDCVLSCPVESCLVSRPPRLFGGAQHWLRPTTAVILAVGIWLVVVGGFRLTGHWHNNISEDEYARRIPDMDSPVYTHVGGMAPAEE